ncbi:MAG: amidohydrolase [Tissierellia bacterium]|nr:amidohydrolase [Tissierellia bacterium]
MVDNDYLKTKAAEIEEWIINIRRDFHKYPELGFEEYRTRDKIIEYLEEMNIEYNIIATTGVVGIIRGKEKGKTVALRADMDALPMTDKKEVSYKSKINGKMHSCGHDAHMAILLGAAKILQELKGSIKGNIKLLFQPAEETLGGAKPMIEEGVLDSPYVDGIFGLHVDNSLEKGTIGIRYGQMKAASDMIDIVIYGKNSHGAYPQNGIDAIAIANQVMSSLQTIVSRNVDPRSSAVLTIGTIKGGYARNIVADKVEMEGIVRTLNRETRKLVLYNIKNIVEKVSQSMGGKGELIRTEGYVALNNHDNMVNIVKQNGLELLGKENIYEMPYPSFGVEDFSFFTEARPSAFFHLGSGNQAKGIVEGGHTPYFDIDEDCLADGVLLQVKNALEFLWR